MLVRVCGGVIIFGSVKPIGVYYVWIHQNFLKITCILCSHRYHFLKEKGERNMDYVDKPRTPPII